MPENRKTQQSNNHINNNVVSNSNPSADCFEEGMRDLKIQTQENNHNHNHNQQDGRGGIGIGIGIGIVHPNPYPDRPGEPDCLYYLRTGLCGYGNTCRFNHPAGKGAQYKGELPERMGQPECQYFLKTGTCKFGASCKFHHPRDKHMAGQVLLNILGLPMRQDEKSCPYYMRTWSCKFGASCKFHHPQPSGVATLPIAGAPVSAANQTGLSYVGGLPTWPLSRTPSNPALHGPRAYMPVVFSSSQGILPAQNRWNTYMGESGSSGQMNIFSGYPERPDQPECQYYMKTGTCKFGAQCKYHHPKERVAPLFTPTSSISPFGLPLRPGQAICAFYSRYGICKNGTSCKFDHPLAEFYSYGVSMPGLSISDSSAIPNMEHSPVSQSSETSPPSKSVVLPDQTKDDVTSSKHQNSDKEVPEDKPRDATSLPRSTTPDGPRDPTN